MAGRLGKPTTTAFGAFVRKRRLELNITLRELAQKADLSLGYLSKLETGFVKNPGEVALQNLASALEVNLRELIQLKSESAPQGLDLQRFSDESSRIDEVVEKMKTHLKLIEATRVSLRNSEEQLAKLAWALELDIEKLEAPK